MLVLFLLRHNNAQDVAAELFGCSQATVSRRWRGLRPVVREVLAELAAQVTAQESQSALLVDGSLAPTGNRDGMSELYSGKRHLAGFKLQAVTNLDGRIVDVGDPLPGGRHDGKAFVEPGIADRFACHQLHGGPRDDRRQDIPRHRDHPPGRPFSLELAEHDVRWWGLG